MKNFWLLPLAVLALNGCSTVSGWFDEDEAPLEGERISVLELQDTLEPDDLDLEAVQLSMPAAWKNAFWPQTGGYPNHAMQNLALNDGPLKRIWRADIGEGGSKALPLTAQPILVDGQIFTLDTNAQLSAFNVENGKLNWRKNVGDLKEDDPVISGGISFSSGLLYVTNGYNELLALRPSDGEIIWRKRIPAPSRAAPTIMDERVFVVTLDNRLLALEAKTGETLWEYAGVVEGAGLIGAASPASSRNVVVAVFSSGEIAALRSNNGSIAWTDNLSRIRGFGGLTNLSDIKALPVMDQGLVIAVSYGGRMVAIDERTGNRVWQREIGSTQTPWVAGNTVFMITSDNELVALTRDTGSIIWVKRLPRYEDEEERENPLLWSGPVMAGSRLIVTGTDDGRVLEFSPTDGSPIRQWRAEDPIAFSPIIAGETLYMITREGVLTAYR